VCGYERRAKIHPQLFEFRKKRTISIVRPNKTLNHADALELARKT